MSDTPVAMVTPADGIPGLFNVQVTSGEQFWDLTVGQVRSLAAQNGWTIVPTAPGGEH